MDELENTQPEVATSAPANTPVRGGINYKKWVLGALVIFIVVGGSFRLGYVSGKKGYNFNTKSFEITGQEGAPQNVDYGLLWQALKIVQDKYIDSSQIDQQKVLYGAIRGAIAAAGDDYTSFFDPQTLNDFKTELQGSFSGIGAEIGKQSDNIVIIAPLDDSPAKKAGLRSKDIIVKIDGVSTSDMAVDEAVNKIRGPEGTVVTLTIFRDGATATTDIKITRQTIAVKSVKWSYKDVNGKKVAVINISRFGDDTKDLFDQAVADIQKTKPSAIVVDLRDNPGGYLDTAVDVASHWLPQGTLIVKEAHSEKDVTTYNSNGSNELGGIKTVVLINSGSASAAEILSGALKDNGKAQLIGEKSFGKGSVQELVPLGKDSAVKVTIAKWITPGGQNLNHNGLDPDIKVELSDTDLQAGKDPQLDKALDEVSK
ncbi:MAG TPA: S41 family peptidase [Patescibacteria group bacterium]|nr:S41 family peptidase [Patescibacteria group bacterium]